MEEGVAQLEPRVAKIEADVASIGSRVANVEIDLRDMRKSMEQRFDLTLGEFKAIRGEMRDEFKAVRAETSSEFKAFRAEMRDEFRVFRADFSAELKAVRTEAREDSRDIRARLDRLWDRVSNLRLVMVVLAIALLVATEGTQSYRAVSQWLLHFK